MKTNQQRRVLDASCCVYSSVGAGSTSIDVEADVGQSIDLNFFDELNCGVERAGVPETRPGYQLISFVEELAERDTALEDQGRGWGDSNDEHDVVEGDKNASERHCVSVPNQDFRSLSRIPRFWALMIFGRRLSK